MKKTKTVVYILLLLFAIVTVVIMTPFVLVYRILKVIITRRADPTWFYRMALSLDQFGNVAADDLFNKIIIKKRSIHRFGDEDETISSVIGRNHLDGTLTVAGDLLRKTLSLVEENHSVKAIEK